MSHREHRIQFGQQQGTPPIIINLLIANVMMYVLQLISNGQAPIRQVGIVDEWLRLYPIGYRWGDFYPWQLISYGFLHGDHMHLIFNMFVLWMFGKVVAQDFGQKRFAIYYFVSIIGAGCAHILVQLIPGAAQAPVLGASGGTMALLVACAWRFPHTRVQLLFPPIPMNIRTMVAGLIVFDLFFGVRGSPFGIAHFAHLGGVATGALILAYWRGKLPLKPKQLLP